MNWFLLATSVVPLSGIWWMLRELRSAQHLRKAGIKAMGQIVRQRQGRGRYGHTRSIPIARFVTQRGRAVEAESASGATTNRLSNGTKVTLYYDPERPNRFMFEQELSGPERYFLLAIAVVWLAVIWLLS
jgi:hypothetical protein